MSARGIRNNNPCNIRASGVHWEGELTPNSDGFCVFDTPEHGIGAAGQNLKAYRLQHGLKTVDSIIRRWSATDQDVYVASVAKALGVHPDGEINVLNPDTLFRLVCAIIRQENGVQPYTYAVICAGLGIGPPIEEVQPAAPIEDHSTPASPEDVARVGGADNSNAIVGAPPMPIAAIISLFGPVLADLIPQLTAIFKPKGDVAQRNTALAQTVVDMIVKTTGQPNVQAAIEAMQADKDLTNRVTQAVVTHKDVMPFLEVGGGVATAREADLKVMASDKPFYKTSAVFWVSMLLLPLVYWYVGSSVVGGIAIPEDWPWYAQMPLKMFGIAWSLDARSGMGNLVIGLVLGGVCGVYFGVSVTQAKQAVPPAATNTGA